MLSFLLLIKAFVKMYIDLISAKHVFTINCVVK